MKHTANWTSLDRAIKDLIGQAKITDAEYLRLWQLGVRGLEELGMDISESPVTRKLPVLPNKIVELPASYVQWVKVGVLNELGEVATLRHNPNLTEYAMTEDDRLEQINTGSYSSNSFFRNYQEGDCYYNLFGVPSGTVNLGEFKVNDVEGVILLDASYQYDHIILEMISSPIGDERMLFPIQIREAVIKWMDWKSIESLPPGRRSNIGLVESKRREFLRLKRLAKRRLNPFRLAEANDIIRINNRLTVKA